MEPGEEEPRKIVGFVSNVTVFEEICWKFATSVIGAFIVTEGHDSPEQLPDPLPVQPVNCQPGFAVSEMGTVVPCQYQPEFGECVPPVEGLASIVK